MSQCAVEMCEQPIRAAKMCTYHYDRKRRYGDTWTRPSEITCAECQTIVKVGRQGAVPAVCQSCAEDIHRTGMREKRREKTLRENYNLSLDAYEEMRSSQQGVCAICGLPQQRQEWTLDGRRIVRENLHVDHDHKTGAVRGLLCSPCNTAIGLLGDDLSRVLEVALYLERHQK